MKKRLSFIAVCIVVLALFLGANTVGCGDSGAAASPDESGDVVDDNSPSDEPAASETPYDPYYWVSTEGSDDNPGTQEKPFRTLYRASWEGFRSVPKDIYIYPGTYVEEYAPYFAPNVSVYGLGSRTVDPVKYRPVIDLRGCGQDFCSFFVANHGSTDTGDRSVTIDGLKIYAKGIGIWTYDIAFTLTNSEIIVGSNGIDDTAGVSVNASTFAGDVLISDNTIRTEDTTDPGSDATGLSISSDAAAIDILDNIISVGQVGDNSLAVSLINYSQPAQNVLVKGNTISTSNASRMSGGISSFFPGTLRIEGNTINVGSVQDQPGESETTMGAYVYAYSTQPRANVTVLNNAIFGGSGGDMAYGIWLHENVDAFILFNTIDAGFGTSDEAVGVYTFEGASASVHNNLLCAGMNDQSYGIMQTRATMAELTHNLFCDDLGVFYQTYPEIALPRTYTDASVINAADVNFANNISGDPNFVDFSGHDYHLVFPSDAVDAGRNVSGVTYDLDGSARTKGQAPDIGAYELR